MASYFMQMVTSTRANGRMIRLMGREHILIVMVPNIKENGKMTNSMGMVSNNGLMELSMKVNTLRERRMEEES